MYEYPLVRKLQEIADENVADLQVRFEKVLFVLLEDKVLQEGSSPSMRFDVACAVFMESDEEFKTKLSKAELEETLVSSKECYDQIGLNGVISSLIFTLIKNFKYALSDDEFLDSLKNVFKEDFDSIWEHVLIDFEEHLEKMLMVYYKPETAESHYKRFSNYLLHEYDSQLLKASVEKVIEKAGQNIDQMKLGSI